MSRVSPLAIGCSLATMGVGIATMVIGLVACPMQSYAMTRAFSILSGVTLLIAVVSALLGARPYDRPHGWMLGVGMIPLACFWSLLLVARMFTQEVREASARTQMINNARQIGLAAHAFHDVHRRLPGDFVNAAGDPLLSWRVAILPYVDQAPLFGQFNSSESWNGPANGLLIERIPHVYRSVLFEQTVGHTPWQGFVGPGTAFERGAVLSMPRDFPDGTSHTILVVEARDEVPWSKPADIPYRPDHPLPLLGQSYGHKGAWPLCCPVRGAPMFHALMADGTVRSFSSDISEKVLRGMIVRNDGQGLAD